MAKIKLVAFVEDPGANPGPYSYKIEPIDFCSGVNFLYLGESYQDLLEVSSDNPSIDFEVETETENCPAILGRLRVTGKSGECMSIKEADIDNVCMDHIVRICPMSVSNNEQILTAGVSGGNGKMSYEWKVYSSSIFIKSGQNTQAVTVDRGANKDAYVIEVTVTDENSCQASHKITVPAVDSDNPTLKDFLFQRKCVDAITKSIVIDIVALGNDPDGTLDLSTIEVTQEPVNGTYVIDYAAGFITYAGNLASAGTQTLKARVRDNNGKWSNEMTATLVLTPCDAAASAADDSFDIECDTETLLDILVNDTTNDGTIDPTTVVIISPPLKGTYTLLSDGKVLYNPNPGESGVDVFRYTVDDTSGDTSDVSTVQVNIEPCCDDHTAGIAIVCSSSPGEFVLTASATGIISGVNTDTFSFKVDDSSTYVPGNVANLPDACKIDSIPYDQSPFGAGGEIFNTQNAIFRVNRVSNFVYSFDIGWPDPTAPSKLDNIQEFVEAALQVIQFGDTNVNQYPDSLYAPNISNLANGSFDEGGTTYYGLSFTYSSDIPLIDCRPDIVAKTLNAHGVISAIAIGSTDVFNAGTSNLKLRQWTYSNIRTVIFKRTITRLNCPVVEIEFQGQWNVEVGCSSLEVTQVGGPVPDPPDNTAIYDVCIEGNINTLSSVIVDGANVLTQEYSIPDDAQALEDYLNNYLDGDGEAQVYTASDKLIIQVVDTTKEFETTITNIGNFPFQQL